MLQRKGRVMLPEERARVKIDKQLNNAGWDIVPRDEYISGRASSVKEALMKKKIVLQSLLMVIWLFHQIILA